MNLLALKSIFQRKKSHIVLGIVGEINAGKTTLANRMGMDLANQTIGNVSEVPHETREIAKLENCILDANGHGRLNLTIVDTPGIANAVDYRVFMERYGMTKAESIQRAKEATMGVIKAIEALEMIDVAIVVVDSARPPFNQVNWMVIGSLRSKNIPIIVCANKVDLPDADPQLVLDTFRDQVAAVIPISALYGDNMDQLYNLIGSLV